MTGANNILAIDKPILTHIENSQQLVVGLINLSRNKLRIEIVKDRWEDPLKKLVELHIYPYFFIFLFFQ